MKSLAAILCAVTLGVACRGESLSLASGEQRTFRFDLKKDQYLEARVVQYEGLVRTVWISPGNITSTMRGQDAGSGSVLRCSFIAPVTGAYELQLTATPDMKKARAEFLVQPPREATELDRRKQAMEESLAQAEWIRRKGDRKSLPDGLSKYAEAASAAVAMADNVILRAALVGKARLLLYRKNDFSGALEASLQAVAVPRPEDDIGGQAAAYKILSSAYGYLAEYQKSIDAINESLALYRKIQDRYWQGILLGNLGSVHRELGNTDEALASVQSALEIAHAIGDWHGIDFDLETIASIYLTRGDFQKALETYQEALDELQRQPFPLAEGLVWSGLGILYTQLDDPARAEPALRKALAAAEKANDAATQITVLNNLADVAVTRRRYKEALESYRQGLKRATDAGLRREQCTSLAGMARCQALLGQKDSALDSFHRSLAISREISQKDVEAITQQSLGDAYARWGQSQDAAAAYAEAERLWKEEQNPDLTALAQASRARLDFAAGNFNQAWDRISGALDLIEASRASLASHDLRTSYFASRHDFYSVAINALMEMDRTEPGKGHAAEALAVVERARARTLLDDVEESGRKTMIARERLAAAYERLRSVDPSLPDAEARTRRARADVERLRKENDDLEAGLKAGSTRVVGSQPISASQMEQQFRDPKSMLLEYWAGENGSYVWSIHAGKLIAARLPPAKRLSEMVSAFRNNLTERARRPGSESLADRAARIKTADTRAEQTARQLGRLLLSPVSTGVERLYIVADGPLWSVPFPALKVPQDPTRYAVSKFEILLEPSASVLAALNGRPAAAAATPVAVFADPVYEAQDPRMKAPGVNHARTEKLGLGNLPRLSSSAQEASDIAAAAGRGADVHLGFNASAKQVRGTDWSRYRIAHFATHALLDENRPAFSGLALSMFNSNGAQADGMLWMHDIYELKMPVSLVVLSGCRTADGKGVPGEGVIGLSRAFLVAGARGVIGSLWSVRDEQTSDLMRAFYTMMLQQHLSSSRALRKAQLQMAQTAATSAPYFWAGFLLDGV